MNALLTGKYAINGQAGGSATGPDRIEGGCERNNISVQT